MLTAKEKSVSSPFQVRLESVKLEKLLSHMSVKAYDNDTYGNAILLCRYFARYGFPEFPALMAEFVKLHKEAADTPSEKPRYIWEMFRARWDGLVLGLFRFIADRIGAEDAAKIKRHFED